MNVHKLRVESEAGTPPRRGVKKGLYLIPSLFTAVNIFAGFYSVMASIRGFQLVGMGGDANMLAAAAYFDYAAMAIGWAMLFDTLDGRIARLTKTTTEIGIQLDSIADVVSFGLAPAVLAFVWGYGQTLQEGSGVHKLAWFLSFMYLMCGGFRLARFNVQASRPRPLSEGTPKVDKKNYIGLPIPVAGAMIAAIVHLAPTPLIQYEPRRAQIFSGLMMALVGFLSLMMVSTLKFSSFKTVGTRVRSTRLAMLGVAMGTLVYLYSRWVLLILVTLYIVHGLVSRIGTSLRPHREH